MTGEPTVSEIVETTGQVCKLLTTKIAGITMSLAASSAVIVTSLLGSSTPSTPSLFTTTTSLAPAACSARTLSAKSQRRAPPGGLRTASAIDDLICAALVMGSQASRGMAHTTRPETDGSSSCPDSEGQRDADSQRQPGTDRDGQSVHTPAQTRLSRASTNARLTLGWSARSRVRSADIAPAKTAGVPQPAPFLSVARLLARTGYCAVRFCAAPQPRQPTGGMTGRLRNS